MHFVETMKIGANEWKYFHSIWYCYIIIFAVIFTVFGIDI
jgi:hypothetical protein